MTDGHPPPDFGIVVVADTPFQCSFHGDHPLDAGDVVRWVLLSQGSCVGAASADGAVYGGTLDSSLSAVIRLPGGVDGTASAVHALCVAEAAGGAGWAT